MFKNQMYTIGLVALLSLLVAACGGTGPAAEPDRVATRVAEEQAVSATLTAAAPPLQELPIKRRTTSIAQLITPNS